jgi:hypothetical protein
MECCNFPIILNDNVAAMPIHKSGCVSRGGGGDHFHQYWALSTSEASHCCVKNIQDTLPRPPFLCNNYLSCIPCSSGYTQPIWTSKVSRSICS